MKLFESLAQRAWVYLFLLAFFAINLAYEWVCYTRFMDEGEREILAKVIRVEPRERNSFRYAVLSLDFENFRVFTTTRAVDKFKQNDEINATLQTLDVGFSDFLRHSFFAPSSDVSVVARQQTLNLKDKILAKIYAQHDDVKISELYGALFLAAPISKDLREDVMRLGVSHLVAISGYHLGVIVSAMFLLFAPIFRLLYAKFAPWRDWKFDIFILSFVLCALYFILIGFVPSFLRAFFMAIFGFFMLVRGVKVFKYETLLMCACACVALFPALLFSIGFYLSLVGVFYIFLYVRHFGGKFGLLAHSFWLNIYLFFTMQICVLYFFPLISWAQILVVPASYAFVIFYPLSFVLHIFDCGNLLDFALQSFLNFSSPVSSAKVNLWQFLVYNTLSLLAIKFKILALFLGILGAFVFIYFQF